MIRKDTLVDRISKAEEFINKKTGTIHKKLELAQIKEQKLQNTFGIKFERIHHVSELSQYTREEQNNIYGLECDIATLYGDVNSLKKQVAEKNEKLLGYKEELEKVKEFEEQMEKEIPEAFKQAKAELVESWTESDMNRRQRMLEDSNTMSWADYKKKWSYTERDYLMHTEEDFRRFNTREAEEWLIDLYNRVKLYTGTITDASHIRFVGKALNGYIHGTMGSCEVETIGAGGYNIQRYHLRVLVKKYNLQ